MYISIYLSIYLSILKKCLWFLFLIFGFCLGLRSSVSRQWGQIHSQRCGVGSPRAILSGDAVEDGSAIGQHATRPSVRHQEPLLPQKSAHASSDGQRNRFQTASPRSTLAQGNGLHSQTQGIAQRGTVASSIRNRQKMPNSHLTIISWWRYRLLKFLF